MEVATSSCSGAGSDVACDVARLCAAHCCHVYSNRISRGSRIHLILIVLFVLQFNGTISLL